MFWLTRPFVVLGYSLWQSQEAPLLGTHFSLPSVLYVLSSVASLILHLGREYVQLAILVVIKVLATIMAPIGMKQLLQYALFLDDLYGYTQRVSSSYLETQGEGSVVRPWVWVTYLFLGPAIGTIAFQWYLFISVCDWCSLLYQIPHASTLLQTGTIVRVTAIVTQLVFEHALRIRVKAETSSSQAPTPTATPEGRSEATTPDSSSAVEINIVSEDAGRGGEEVQSEQSMTAASSIKGKRKEEAPSGSEDGNEPTSSRNLVGKMNNLVSTDLENLVDGRDFLPFRLSSFPFSPCSPLLMKDFLSFICSAAGRGVRLVFV
jgi:hypothetical protein